MQNKAASRQHADRPRDPGADPAREAGLGRHAHAPVQIPWRGWKQVLKRTISEMISDRIGLAAAGCAFYATLALFPGISMLVSLYGLVFDPQTVEPQMKVLAHLLPAPAYTLIADRIHMLVSKDQGTLTVGLIISLLITMWSSSASTKSMLAALNIAYDERETRSFLRYQVTALGMTLGAILGAALTLALLVFLPALLDFLPKHLGAAVVEEQTQLLIRVGSPVLMVLFVAAAFSTLYRFGPARQEARWHWITPGAVVSTALWLLASWGFSYYVGHIASYDATYGPLGAVVGIMMWFFVTAYVVLLGAELNAELELQTAQDSTTGEPQPIGNRGAFVADHVAEE
jgi:membrane protein